jgi:hypothetical protein
MSVVLEGSDRCSAYVLDLSIQILIIPSSL